MKLAAKVATAGLVDLDELTEEAISGLAESLAREQLERYETSKNSIKSFRTTISNFANSITDAKNPRPLVFIIDELDRCRPNYAIEILEKAKHLFNVHNIIFVLGADKKQLGSSIKAIYGEGLDVNGYLRRFMDFDYVLPPPDKGVFVKALFQRYAFNSFLSKKNKSNLRHEIEQALAMFSALFELYGLTLREQEHCCSLLSLAIRTTTENHKIYPLFLCYLIVLKVKYPDLYKDFITDRIDAFSLMETFEGQPSAAELLSTNQGKTLEAYILTSKSFTANYNRINEKYNSIISSGSRSDDKKRAERMLEIINSFGSDYGYVDSLGYLLKRIEIASRFKESKFRVNSGRLAACSFFMPDHRSKACILIANECSPNHFTK